MALGTISGLAYFAAVICLQIVFAPLVLHFSGQETLGAYSIIMQVVAYLTLVDLGFGITVNRFLAQASVGAAWPDRFNAVFTFARTYVLVTNLILGLLIFVLSMALPHFASLSAPVASDARLGLWILAAWSVFRTPFAIYGLALTATQNIVSANLCTLLGTIGRFAFGIILVIAGYGLTGLLAAWALGEAIAFIFHRKLFIRKYPQVKAGWGIPDGQIVREMMGFSVSTFLITLVGRLSFSSDSIIVGGILGAAAASVYYTTQMPAFTAFSAIFRIGSSAEPAINELYALGDKVRLRLSYLKLHRYTLIVALPVATSMVVIGEEAITLWVGKSQFAGSGMIAILAIFTAMVSFSNTDYTYLIAQGAVGHLARFSVFEGIGNIVLSVVLAYLIGMTGVMLATCIIIAPRVVWQSCAMRSSLQISLGCYIDECLRPIVVPLFVATGVLWLAMSFGAESAWLNLLTSVGLFVAVFSMLAWYISITFDERRAASRFIHAHLTTRRRFR